MRRPKVVSQSKTLDETYGEVRVDASASAVTITLPLAREQIAREYTVKKTDSSVNAVTLAANGNDVIDGDATQALSAQYDSITVKSNGIDTWDVIARAGGAGGMWTLKKKTADESATADTSLSNDAELSVTLPPGRYHLRGKVALVGNDPAMGYKYQLVFSGALSEIFWHRRHTSLSAAAGTDAENTAQGINTPPATAVS